MTLTELNSLLIKIIKGYFTQAQVMPANQSFVPSAKKSLVTVAVGNVKRATNPPVKVVDGIPVKFYPACAPLTINLFTGGLQKDIAPGYTPISINTAQDDMLDFADYLNSDHIIQLCHEHDIALLIPDTVQDLTGIVNDTNYRFRAMMEATVCFTMASIGYTGILDDDSVVHKRINPDGTEDIYTGGDIQADDVVSIDPTIKPTPSGGGGVIDDGTGDNDSSLLPNELPQFVRTAQKTPLSRVI